MADTAGPRLVIWTIGHSTRPFTDFVALLQANGIEQIVDIRSIPRSRRNPQYDQRTLVPALHGSDVRYRHLPGLGGRRRARADSVNTGWRHPAFRGYADYMETTAFREALDDCIDIARAHRTAIMCAEAVPWRCHRSLVADALLVRGIDVFDIIGVGQPKPHRLTPWARIQDGMLRYPADGDDEHLQVRHSRRRR